MSEGSFVGSGTAIGIGVGTAFFAATGAPLWIGAGAVVGAAIALAWSRRRNET